MLRCKEVTSILASSELESSGWARQLGVRMHLVLCRHCRRYWTQMKAIASAVRLIFRAPYSGEEIQTMKKLEKKILEALPPEPPENTPN